MDSINRIPSKLVISQPGDLQVLPHPWRLLDPLSWHVWGALHPYALLPGKIVASKYIDVLQSSYLSKLNYIYRFIMVHRWFDLSNKAWVQMSARCSSSGVVCPSVPKNFSRQAEMETTTEKLKHQKCEETSWNIRKRKDTLQLPVVPIHACRSP